MTLTDAVAIPILLGQEMSSLLTTEGKSVSPIEDIDLLFLIQYFLAVTMTVFIISYSPTMPFVLLSSRIDGAILEFLFYAIYSDR